MRLNLEKFALVQAERITQADVDRLACIRIPNAEVWAKHLAAEVGAGATRLSHIQHNGATIGTLTWRIESDVERELVVMSAAAAPGYSVTSFLAQAIEGLALAQKCDSARFHTIRPGLVKFAQERGWHTAEIVMRKNFSHV